jgi:hypothetical protein
MRFSGRWQTFRRVRPNVILSLRHKRSNAPGPNRFPSGVKRSRDVSGSQGYVPEGWVYPFRDGDSWDQAALQAFGIPMRTTDPRRDIKGLQDVLLTCEPVYEQDEIAKPVSPKRLPTGPSYNVDIKVQLGEKCVPMKITNSIPTPTTVEAQARIVGLRR